MTVGDVDVYARGYKNSRGLDSPGVNIATTITVCTLRKSKLHAKYSILVNFSIFFLKQIRTRYVGIDHKSFVVHPENGDLLYTQTPTMIDNIAITDRFSFNLVQPD